MPHLVPPLNTHIVMSLPFNYSVVCTAKQTWLVMYYYALGAIQCCFGKAHGFSISYSFGIVTHQNVLVLVKFEVVFSFSYN